MPMADVLRVLLWWGIFFCYGLLTLPFSFLLFRRLADKGYFFSRILGYIFVAYLMFAFSVAHILKFTVFSLLLCAILLLAAQAIVFWRHKEWRQSFFAWIRSGSFFRHALLEEIFFFALLLIWAYLRGCRPDLDSLEKPMNLGFINAMLNSDYSPAQDMWAAGESINYYYFGHFCVACATRLSGLPSDVAYNLMMATLFAGACMGVFSLSYNLLCLRRKGSRAFAVGGGVLSSIMACLAGNSHYFIYGIIVPFLQKKGITVSDEFLGIEAGKTYSYWFPNATRYIGYQPVVEKDRTITEFPIYSFIVSDLHAHVMDMLAVLLFLSVALSFLLSEMERIREYKASAAYLEAPANPPKFNWLPSPYVLVMGAIIGIFSMTNFWDYPIYIVVSLFFFAYLAWNRCGFQKLFWVYVAYWTAILFAMKTLISLPFSIGFTAMFSGIGIVRIHSKFYQLLVLWGVPLLLSAIFAVWLCRNKRREQKENSQKPHFSLADFEVQDIFVLILCICGFGLAFGTEFVYVRDIYENGYPRSNTMFKLSYQAFILFGIAVGYIVARIADAGRKPLRTAFVTLLMLLLCTVNILYAFNAIPAWYGKREYVGLEGLDYIKTISVTKDENGEKIYPAVDAIAWVKENTPRDAVILEAYGDSYTKSCYLSMATGRATIVGWQTHEWLWHNSYPYVKAKQNEVDAVYECEEEEEALQILRKYGVDYILLGTNERTKYGSDLATDTILSWGEVVFEEGSIRIVKLSEEILQGN